MKTRFLPLLLILACCMPVSAQILSGILNVQAASGSTVATPTFSPVAGSYSSAQSVTISDATAGAVIWYNNTGTFTGCTYLSCSGATQYTTAVSVSTTQTLYAIGTHALYANSSVGSAAYTISGGCSLPSVTSQWLAVANANSTGNPGLSDSVGGNPASQTVSGDAPTYTSGSPSYITFNGTSDFLTLSTSIPDSNTTYSFHVVIYWSSGPNYMIGDGSGSLGYRLNTAGQSVAKVGTGNAAISSTALTTATAYALTAVYNTSTKAFAFYHDTGGTSTAETSGTATAETYSNPITTLFGSINSTYINAKVYEIDFYNGTWSSTDAATLATYDHCMGYN
jgi:hypothetical protein